MSLPFIDLQAQYRGIQEKIQANIEAVLNHGRYIMGPEVTELEQKLAEFTSVKHVISCSSGTDALLMPLMAYEVGPGDAIFTTPFTFIATAEVIALLGATPVFVDIDRKTYNIDPDSLAKAIVKVKEQGKLKAKGIIPVDLFGLPADYEAIDKVAQEHGLFVIEDTAQGLGGRIGDNHAGSFGDVAATSFFPAKPLGAYGDGGAIFTNDDKLAELLVSIRIHGKGSNKYDNVRLGLNGRLDTLQAAVLLVKLSIFEEELTKRQHIAGQYSEKLADYAVTPFVPEGYYSSWAQYSILTEKREHLQSVLKAKGIPTAIYYPKSLHQQQAFANLDYQTGDFPISEEISQKIVSLPMHPYLKEEDIQLIANAAIDALK